MLFDAADFGEQFTWGVSSSAFQTEGAHLEDGKGLSIWDQFCHIPGNIKGNHHPGTACDFYNHYIQDLILMNYMNIRHFRLSLSWSRLLPEGYGQINQKGVAHYDKLIDTCLEQGITPWVTLYHWDLPQSLEDKGGWTNRSIIHWFTEYVNLCIKRYGDRVKHWMVLNEPLAFTGAGYFMGIHAPGRKGLQNFLQAMHHATLSQAVGCKVIQSLDSSLQVGTTFSMSHIEPVDSSSRNREAAKWVDALLNRIYLEPIFGYGYPWYDLKILQQVEKYMLAGDEDLMECKFDFIGLQNYTREVVQYTPFIPYINARIIKASNRNVPTTSMGWEIYPEGIYHCLKKLAKYKQIKKIIVTENGAAFDDQLTEGAVHDQQRIDFYNLYLQQVLRARNEGVPVEGYFAWSFTDNFEWAEGFDKRFGLVYIDYNSQRRIIKASGNWYKNFLKQQHHAGMATG